MNVKAFIIFLFFSFMRFNEVALEESVYILTDSNAEDFVKKQEFVFVKFYAPWCGHCKKMAGDYKQLGQKFNIDGSNIKIAKVDSTIHKKFSEKHGIEGFPTIKLFINGEPVNYEGERNTDAMTKFINKHSQTEIKVLQDKGEIDQIRKQEISIIFVVPKENTAFFKQVSRVSKNFENIEFGVVFDSSILPMEIKHNKAIVFFRKFDDGDKIIELKDEVFTDDFFKQTINSFRFPIVQNFDQEAANRIFGDQKEAFFYFDDSKENSNINLFKEIAKKQKELNNPMIFSISTITTGFGQKLAEYLAVPKDQVSARIIKFDQGELIKYKVEDLSSEGFNKALQDFKDNKLIPYYKSEPIPERNTEAVKVIVSDSFNQHIQSGKYVLIEAYAPWCGHCKSLEPIYKELAEKLLPYSDKITIGKFDGTLNEHEKMPVKGFPTIRLFKPNVEKPIDYEGGRTLNELLMFLSKETGMDLIEEKKEEVKTEEL